MSNKQNDKFYEDLVDNGFMFRNGDKVKWVDPVTRQVKKGTLLSREQLVVTMSAYNDNMIDHEERGEKIYCWDVKGDDGKRYSIREEGLEVVKAN